MKRRLTILTATTALPFPSAAALAAPPPPAPGNGAGKSGQCTGPQADRPASCQSQGGPGDQP